MTLDEARKIAVEEAGDQDIICSYRVSGGFMFVAATILPDFEPCYGSCQITVHSDGSVTSAANILLPDDAVKI
ncbi:MAG: hypothetical protein ACRDAX_03105 [Propionibacteriaceae bacterium]